MLTPFFLVGLDFFFKYSNDTVKKGVSMVKNSPSIRALSDFISSLRRNLMIYCFHPSNVRQMVI